MKGRVVIAGASGVVGSAVLEAFLDDGWDVVALSRRVPEIRSRRPFEHLSVDLQDAAAASAALGVLDGVTHLAFAALYEMPGLVDGWSDPQQMETNLAMLRNCIESLTGRADTLQHVTIMQGTKAYGVHLHVMDLPARETAPRDPHANFYWLQEDYLKERGQSAGFAYTVMRPPMVMGGAIGAAMNLAPVLGAYAAICREEGRPFGFPGGAPYVTRRWKTPACWPRWRTGRARRRKRVIRFSTSATATSSIGAAPGRRSPTPSGSKSATTRPCRLPNICPPRRVTGI